MERISEFSYPTQVAFYDWGADEWVGGIGIDDKVLAGDNGEWIEINDIYSNAPDTVEDPLREYDDWIDISDDIMGDDKSED